MVDILEYPEALEPRITYIQNQLETAELPDIYCLMRDCYYMTFLKYTRKYMSRQDFSEYLGFAWVAAENPNQDKNVSKTNLLTWFKNTDKPYLMEKEDNKMQIIKVPRSNVVIEKKTLGDEDIY